MAVVLDGNGMDKHMFDARVAAYYAEKTGNVKPWSKDHMARVVQYINGANLAQELGQRRSTPEIYFSRSYDILSVDGVQRVISKKTREDGSVRVILTKDEFFDTIQSYHERMGHVGSDKLFSAVQQRFVIPRHIVSMFISNCKVCNELNEPVGERVIRKPKKGTGKKKILNRGLRRNENTQTFVPKVTQNPVTNKVPVEKSPVPQAPPTTQKQPPPPQQPPPQPQKLVPQQVPAPKPIAPKPTATPISPLQPLPPPPEVCLRWNSYHSNMQATFPSLLNNEQFVDVTLACEGRSIKCHKMMLSACSAYFEELLSQNPCQHPIVLMKDLKYWEVQALVDFMYRGEVNVAQDKLPSLLAAAEALQIKGLAGPAFSSHDEENSQSSTPLNSAEDYLDESMPSPSGGRRARKRRVMSSAPSLRPQTVQSPQIPMTPTRIATGKRSVKPASSMPSTSNYQHESSSLPSEPPTRRLRKSDSGELEIKIEPIDIEISNDSMDQIDDSFMEKSYEDTEAGDGGESSCQGDDPGGTSASKKAASSDTRMKVHGLDSEQMEYGSNNGASQSDQNFTYEDSGSQDGAMTVPDLPGTSYQDPLSQPSSSGMNSSSGNLADNLLGHM